MMSRFQWRSNALEPTAVPLLRGGAAPAFLHASSRRPPRLGSCGLAVSMRSEEPLTLILSPLRAGRGELERTCLGSLFGDPDTVPPKVPLSLRKRERVRVRVRLDCMDTA